MRIAISLLSILQIVMLSVTQAQDIHWSQINQLQAFQNPATIGQYEEEIKFTLAARDQWRSVTQPYQTYLATLDTKIRKLNWLSVGSMFFTDVTGDGSFKTNQLDLIAKMEKKLNAKFSLSIGVDFGLTNKNIIFNNFKFDNQYDGIKYNNTLPTNESYSNISFNHLTIGTGLCLNYKIKKNQEINTGISFNNLNKPNESFYQLEIIRPIRNTFYISYNYQFQKHLINPFLNFEKQNSYNKLLIGLIDNQKLHNLKIHHLHYGLMLRYLDAFILNIGLSYLNTKFSLSYDINTSKLKMASNGRGSIEINIQYLLKKKPLTFKIKPSCIDYF